MRHTRIAVALVLALMSDLFGMRAAAAGIQWFNPINPRIVSSGPYLIVPGASTVGAVRVEGTSPLQNLCEVLFPISLPAGSIVDSMYVCFFTGPGISIYRGAALHVMTLPTSLATAFDGIATVSDESGVCHGLDVPDLVVDGALLFGVKLTALGFFEIGAIGVVLKTATVGVMPGSLESPTGVRLTPRPNPFARSVLLELEIPEAGEVRIGIFDIAGRAVRTISLRADAAGTRRVEWDGLDDAGQALPPGTYFSRVESSRGVGMARMVMLQ